MIGTGCFPGLGILKFVAIGDKPECRLKDWEDFMMFTRSYGELAGGKLFDGEHTGLIPDNFKMPLATARLLGRQMQPFLFQE